MAGNKYLQVRGYLTAKAGWGLFHGVMALLIALPFVCLIFFSLRSGSENWQHIIDHVLYQVLKDTLLLAFGSSIMALCLGITSAFALYSLKIRVKSFFKTWLILPLAIPSYILAFSYSELGSFGSWGHQYLGLSWSIKSYWGGMIIFALSLYPYVFLPVSLFMEKRGDQLNELGKSLGLSKVKRIYKVFLPMMWPYALGGALLVGLEVLNDYGVSKYLGINTLSVAIMKTWTGMNDLVAALKLSLILFALSLVLLRLEPKNQDDSMSDSQRLVVRLKNSKWALLLLTFIGIISFVVPSLNLIVASLESRAAFFRRDLFVSTYNSMYYAFLVALTSVIIALMIEFSIRVFRLKFWLFNRRWLSSAYATPGIIIALCILAPALALDRWSHAVNPDGAFRFSQGLLIIIYALSIRFYAVAYRSIAGGYKGISLNYLDLGKTFGLRPVLAFFKIEWPLIKPYLFSAFILVFVDVLKELPITILLRPFNVETLATRTFFLASDELLKEAAGGSLFIIGLSLLAILFVRKNLNYGT